LPSQFLAQFTFISTENIKHVFLIEQQVAKRRVSQHVPGRKEKNVAAMTKREKEKTRTHNVVVSRKRGWSVSPAIKKDDALRKNLAEHEIASPSNGNIIPHSRHFCAFALRSRSLSHIYVYAGSEVGRQGDTCVDTHAADKMPPIRQHAEYRECLNLRYIQIRDKTRQKWN